MVYIDRYNFLSLRTERRHLSNILFTLFFCVGLTRPNQRTIPVDTRRRFNVYITLTDREKTWKRRRVSTGITELRHEERIH